MRRILTVDDEPRITKNCEEAFCDAYEVTSANDGDEAIRLIREKQPELILLDWRLKGEIEGKDILKFTKQKYPNILVYVVTASIHSRMEIESLGADGCFLKPCHDLRDKIEAVFPP